MWRGSPEMEGRTETPPPGGHRNPEGTEARRERGTEKRQAASEQPSKEKWTQELW